MDCGVPGRTGLSVPKPVEEGKLRGEENVTVLHHHMVVDTVRVMPLREEIVAKIHVSCLATSSSPDFHNR